MIKIQTVVKISAQFPTGHSDEYIWLDGQPWPIAAENHGDILKIECFGPELQNERIKALGGGEQLSAMPMIDGVPSGPAVLQYRTWIRDEAVYVSRQMKTFYP